MNLKALTIEGRTVYKAGRRNDDETNALQSVPAPRPIRVRNENHSGERSFEPQRNAPTRLVPPPKAVKREGTGTPMLTRVLSLLRGGTPAPKQLRLAETVALGEKRFVAIIHAQGRQYLVGGGASGVVLLTELNEPAQPRNVESIRRLVEATG